jgi:glycosyltransferase involved in cell wall biosynthesis
VQQGASPSAQSRDVFCIPLFIALRFIEPGLWCFKTFRDFRFNKVNRSFAECGMSGVAILIPVFNEELALPLVLAGIPAGNRVVVCDNGSTDQSVAIAQAAGAEVASAPKRGYGSAVQAGIRYLQAGEAPDIVVIWDGDCSVDPGDLPVLLEPIRQGWAELVLGDRTDLAEAGALTPQQRYGNKLACFLIARQTGVLFADMGPFRAIRFQALLSLQMQDPTWGWNVEMQLKAVKQGLRVVEVPVHCRQRVGVSKISGNLRGVIRAGVRIVQACWKYR